MPRGKVCIRRIGGMWVCVRPTYGFGDFVKTRMFLRWRAAIDWANTAAGSVSCADMQRSDQLYDAVGSVPMWTPLTFH